MMMIIFSYIWSAGGNVYDTINLSGRVKFSKYLKSKLLGFFTSFPFEGEIYDHYIDFQSKKFKSWQSLIPEFIFDPNLKFFDLIVPTAETFKYEYLLSMLAKGNNNILFSGNSGVGKSNMIQNYLKKLDDTFISHTINFCA